MFIQHDMMATSGSCRPLAGGGLRIAICWTEDREPSSGGANTRLVEGWWESREGCPPKEGWGAIARLVAVTRLTKPAKGEVG